MTHPVGQDATTLWQSIREAVNSAGATTLERAAGCVAVALGEMVVSARTAKHRDVAAALSAGHGPCTVTAAPERACVTGAATANAYLMHARLTDDSYRVAAHPGLAVVPVGLAAAEWATRALDRSVDGITLLRSVIGGYECACRLADQLLPVVATRVARDIGDRTPSRGGDNRAAVGNDGRGRHRCVGARIGGVRWAPRSCLCRR